MLSQRGCHPGVGPWPPLPASPCRATRALAAPLRSLRLPHDEVSPLLPTPVCSVLSPSNSYVESTPIVRVLGDEAFERGLGQGVQPPRRGLAPLSMGPRPPLAAPTR